MNGNANNKTTTIRVGVWTTEGFAVVPCVDLKRAKPRRRLIPRSRMRTIKWRKSKRRF